MDNDPTAEELRRVARWLASVGLYHAAGQCHRRAWQLEKLDHGHVEPGIWEDGKFYPLEQLDNGRRDDGETLDETLDTIPNRPAR